MDAGRQLNGGEAALLDSLNQLLGEMSPSLPTALADRDAGQADGEVDRVIDAWACDCFRTADVSGWSSSQALRGLAALERLDRAVVAVRAALIARVGLGRDTAAAVTRSTGMSQRAARGAVRIAQTISEIPEVGDRLGRGEVSAAQVGAVAGLPADDALGLLDVATGQSDDEFARTVERFKVDVEGRTRADRQRALRSVRFSEGPDGCVRLNAVLPAVEGAEVRGMIDRACDAAWKAAHPERARTVGGHEGEPRERRMADALVGLLRGDSSAGRVGAPAIIVTVDVETMRATLLPDTPIDPMEVVGLLERAEVYAAIRDHTKAERLSFGRNRRLASPMQRLVLAMLQPRCVVDGCDVPAGRCEVHHVVEFDDGGRTDLENLANLCPAHHHHHHEQESQCARRPGRTRSGGKPRKKDRGDPDP